MFGSGCKTKKPSEMGGFFYFAFKTETKTETKSSRQGYT